MNEFDIDNEIVAKVEDALLCLGGKVKGDELIFKCIAHDDSNPSASYNIAKKTWNCFSCGAGGGILDLCDRLDIVYKKETYRSGDKKNERIELQKAASKMDSYVTSGSMTESERSEKIKIANTIFFDSSLEFLKSHNGLRPRNVHLVISSKGAGKSVLNRTVIKDVLKHNPLTEGLVILSEESAEDYKTELSFSDITTKELDRLKIYSAPSHSMSEDVFFHWIENYLNDNGTDTMTDFILIDNITTMPFYDSANPSKQSAIAYRIKKIAMDFEIPIIIIAHSGGNLNRREQKYANENSIRGSRAVVNIAECVYMLERVDVKDTIYQFLHIQNTRGQQRDHSLFSLAFNKSQRIFDMDAAINFERYKEFTEMMNRL